MSKNYGEAPKPRLVSIRQERTGTTVMVVAVPLVLAAGAGPLEIPKTVVPTIPGFGLTSAQAKRTASGDWEWELTFEGEPVVQAGTPQNSDEQAIYSLDTSDAEVPITSLPDWLKIKEKYKGDVKEGIIEFQEELPVEDSDTGSKKNPMFKVEAYLSFGAVWSKTYVTKTLPGDLFNGIESIVSTIPQPRSIKIPRLGRGRNWLKRVPSIRVRGTVLEITERYLLSGRGGWNKDVYKLEGNG